MERGKVKWFNDAKGTIRGRRNRKVRDRDLGARDSAAATSNAGMQNEAPVPRGFVISAKAESLAEAL